ncbi:MAG TPA: hypothetical protein VHC95_06145 [Opitutales bacterium]|nr:hypothetical protein [Opitutales bacterium]
MDWSLTTWKGSRLQQHRKFRALPFARKLEVLDDLQETMRALQPVKPPKKGKLAAKL